MKKTRSFLRRRAPSAVLFQVTLLGTAVAAARTLQSPSTLTFFVLECALGSTVGFFLADRAIATRLASSGSGPDLDFERDENRSSSGDRIRVVGTKLGLSPVGRVPDLQQHIRAELPNRPEDPNARDDSSKSLKGVGTSRSPAGGALKEEGSRLASLAEDIGILAEPQTETPNRAFNIATRWKPSIAGRSLTRGSKQLRGRIRAKLGQDLREGHPAGSRAFPLLTSVFILAVATAILVLQQSLYVAPIAAYFLLAGATGVVALNAQLTGNQRPRGVLVQIMMLAILVKCYFFYLNPYVYTSDGFLHYLGIQSIEITGHVPETLGHYYYFPAYHVFGFAGVALSGLPLTWHGAMTFPAQIMTVAVAYLIGRKVANPRVGLFASILTLLSLFFFLSVTPVPSLFGFLFLFLTMYALIQMREGSERGWLAVFWVSALGAFFSHPINALVLLLILLLRFIYLSVAQRATPDARKSAIPAVSYGVVYVGYLSFIALVSFETMIRTMFGTADVPTQALATIPDQLLQRSGSYVLQSALAPSAAAFLFFFFAYGMLSPARISTLERRSLALLGLAFVALPALEFASQDYRAQSSRFLLYMTIPLVLIGGHGAASLIQERRPRRSAVAVLTIFLILTFVSAPSYLTGSDVRFLASTVPAMPTHITESALASRAFLAKAANGSSVFMEFGSWLYFENSGRSRYPLRQLHTDWLEDLPWGERAFVEVNNNLLVYGNPYLGSLYDVSQLQLELQDARASRMYDAGGVQVYLTS